ncbi:MAG: helix-turn-helix domain-containing protein [Planctomycetota bacterium]
MEYLAVLDIISMDMEEELTPLAKYLRSLRKASRLTLRTVEEKTGVSNAFLCQLELGKVKHPSPVVLHKVAQTYGVTYEVLMEAAGYPVPQSVQDLGYSGRLLNRLGPISEEEEEWLVDFLAFLRSRATKEKGKP